MDSSIETATVGLETFIIVQKKYSIIVPLDPLDPRSRRGAVIGLFSSLLFSTELSTRLAQ